MQRLLDVLVGDLNGSRIPLVLGLAGLQGSGKSTLAAQLVEASRGRRIPAWAMSIDDFYLGRRARLQLARDVHPLLVTRGVPGTHDVALIESTLDALARATPKSPARVPRFDKGRDTRMPPSRWRRVDAMPRLIVLEGWCVGVPAQSRSALRVPVNALEREEDADARWRTLVNELLADGYARLWQRLDRLVLLRAPSFDVVSRWRDEQEHSLRRSGATRAMSARALSRFVQHFERLSRHALKTLPGIADIVITLDAGRRVRGMTRHARRMS